MSEITTTVRLYSGVPFDSEYEHIVLWNNSYTQRDAYFENYLVKAITMPYFCVGDEFDIDIEYANIGVAPNYLSYTSHIYPGNKYFFIDTITQITDGKIVRLHCIMDWWQTYFANYGYSAPNQTRFQLNKNYTRLIEGDYVANPDAKYPLVNFGSFSGAKIPKLSYNNDCVLYLSLTGTLEENGVASDKEVCAAFVASKSGLTKGFTINQALYFANAIARVNELDYSQEGEQTPSQRFTITGINQILLLPREILTGTMWGELYTTIPTVFNDTMTINRLTSSESNRLSGGKFDFHNHFSTTAELKDMSLDKRAFLCCGARQIEVVPLNSADKTLNINVSIDVSNSQCAVILSVNGSYIDLTADFTVPVIRYTTTQAEYMAAKSQAYAGAGLQALSAASMVATGNYLPAIGGAVGALNTIADAEKARRELSISSAPSIGATVTTDGIILLQYIPQIKPFARPVSANGNPTAFLSVPTASHTGIWYRFSDIMIGHDAWNSTSDYYWRIPHKYVREFYAIAKRGFYLHGGGIYPES